MQTSAQSTSTYSFTDDGTISLELKNHSGDVAIVHDAPEGTAEVTLSASRPVDFAPVTAECRRGRVLVDVPALLDPDGASGFAFSFGSFSFGAGHEEVHVEVHLPARADVSASTKRGDIVLQGLSGQTTVRSGSGDIAVEESGRLRASTGSGDIRVDQLAGGAVSSGSGDIVVERSTGEHPLEIRTGSGDVSLVESGHDATIATGSGDVVAHHRHGSFTARTGTGDVEVAVPTGIPVWLDLSSGIGQIRRDIDSVGAPAEGQDHLTVSIRTGTGDITVRH